MDSDSFDPHSTPVHHLPLLPPWTVHLSTNMSTSQVTTLSKVTMELGMEEKDVLVEKQDDEMYSGLAVYQIFEDYSLLPSQVC